MDCLFRCATAYEEWHIDIRTDIINRQATEALLAERSRIQIMTAEVAAALVRSAPLRELLSECLESMVRGTGAVLMRIWTSQSPADAMVLQASAGLPSLVDSAPISSPVAQSIIGFIARNRRFYATNDVQADPNICNPAWVKEQGLAAFAGYPLIVDERLLGVMAIFACQPLTPLMVESLEATANLISVGIERKWFAEKSVLFRTLIDQMKDTIEVLEPATGRVLDVNEAGSLAHGYTREEYLALTVMDVDPDETAATWPETVKAAQQPGFRSFQGRHRRKDGSIFPTEIHVNFIHLDRDYMLSVVHDITEQQRTEAALHAVELRLKHVVASSPAILFTVIKDGDSYTINWISDNVLPILGYQPSEPLIRNWWHDHIHPDDLPQTLELFQKHLRLDGRVTIDYRFKHKNNEYRWLRDDMRYFNSDGNDPSRFVGSCTDITEIKEADQRFKHLVASSLSVLFELSNIGGKIEIIWVSDNILSILGYQPNEALNPNWWYEHIHPDDLAPTLGDIQQHLFIDGLITNEYRFRHCNHGYRWLRSEIRYHRADGDIHSEIIGSFSDITEIKEAALAVKKSQMRFQAFMDHLPAGVWIMDGQDRIVLVNKAMAEMFGKSQDAVLGKSIGEMLPPSNRSVKLQEDRELLIAGGSCETTETFVMPDGSERVDFLVRFPIQDPAGEKYIGAIVMDITALHLAEERIKLLSIAVTAAANAIFITDVQGSIQWVNGAFCHLSGYSEAELIGANPRILKSKLQDPSVYPEMWKQILAGKTWISQVFDSRKDGTEYTIAQTITPLVNDFGKVTHFVAVQEDVTQRNQAEKHLRYLGRHDALTGLYNRIVLRERLAEALEGGQRTGTLVAVFFLDLDHFKLVNDGLGHATGDALLCLVADRLRECLRSTDTVARLGGDEFAIIQTNLKDPRGAAALAAKVVEALARPFDVFGHAVRTSTSVGITVSPNDVGDADQLMSNADLAMYEAKQQGRNNYRFYTASLNDLIHSRVILEQELRLALERDELRLFYQPKFELAALRPAGAEALIRWEHPTRGLLAPGEFIGVAEESGLIIPIGQWVITKACADIQAWRNQGRVAGRIAVNVSAAQIRNDELVPFINQALAAAGLYPGDLEVEITETLLMRDFQNSLHILEQIHDLGVELAIDDFGVGYSSLKYLRQFPVSRLKIDKSFVDGLCSNSKDLSVVKAIIALGHNLGMKLVAEGIESAAQLATLRAEGCDEGQGFLMGKPVPAAEFLQRYTRVCTKIDRMKETP